MIFGAAMRAAWLVINDLRVDAFFQKYPLENTTCSIRGVFDFIVFILFIYFWEGMSSSR